MATYAGTYKARLGKMFIVTPPVVWTLPIQAAQTFVSGEFVYRSGGYVVTCADDPQQILGIAKADAPQADGEIEVLIATGMTGIKIPVHHTTPGNADIEIGNLGTEYQLAHVAGTGVWYVDKDNTESPSVRIQQFIDALGTVNGKVIVTVNYDIREVA